MPRTISSFALSEKNKLASRTAWLVALEVSIPGVATPVRVIDNTESVTWRGESWIAIPFTLGNVSEESTGEVPQVDLQISNVSRVMEAYLQEYDLYTKTNGFSPITVNVYVIANQAAASGGVVTEVGVDGAVTTIGTDGALTDTLLAIVNPDPEAEFLYELTSPKTNSQWASLSLGAANPFNHRFPQNRILRNHCRFRFKDTLCAYAGAETTCDKTLTRCRALSNSSRYGGFPGVGTGGLRLANN